MKKIFDLLSQFARWKTIIAGFILIVAVNLILNPLIFFNYMYGNEILDLQFGFSAAKVREIFKNYTGDQRFYYSLTTLFIDSPYALIYGLTYSLLLFKLNTFANRLKNLVLLPVAVSVFDLIENAGIVYLSRTYPEFNDNVVPLFSAVNRLKWIFAGLSLLWLTVLLFHRFFIYSSGSSRSSS